MSLINDALKQIKQSRQQSPPANPAPLPPVESAARGNGNWLAPVIIILLFAAAGIFIGLSLSRHARPTDGTPLMAATMTQRVETAAIVPAPVTNPPPNTNTASVAPPQPPEPKLQGILFAATRPCAIISGRTVFVGDQINEFRVAAISKDAVILQDETVTNVLSLSRP
ncbi:MAG TPA: hypothetical protein VMA35_08485 [Candidatus Sulfopaludibacter sp.]|nr:hypothetical protein [Candidatus Sulfopaludibacter sp.]